MFVLSVTVKVRDLYALAKQMLDDGMDTVEISFMEADQESQLPPALHFEASESASPEAGVDYEELEELYSTK